jgi:hypothetical protein
VYKIDEIVKAKEININNRIDKNSRKEYLYSVLNSKLLSLFSIEQKI